MKATELMPKTLARATPERRPALCCAEASAVYGHRRSLPGVYPGSLLSSRAIARLPDQPRHANKSEPRRVCRSIDRSIRPRHRPVPCKSESRPIKSKHWPIPRKSESRPIKSIPREGCVRKAGSINSVTREVGRVTTSAAASEAEPGEAGVTVGCGPAGVGEVRPTPTEPLSLGRSSRRNCETHAKDRQCCANSTIQHCLFSCGILSAFELLAGQRRNRSNV